ncbi:hypothetical protein Taro_025914 [Colocasia esculenta]|uniref:Retrotransposon gag domain-containing protein n=1 Tax=Colocasia esculenta TaxID=4460 RepID=A0A843VBH1_COLES|nr:hypothetical protein [Colocasia esculenta]
MAAEEQSPPTPQAAPVQPEVPPVTPVVATAPEDRMALLERFLHLRTPMFYGDYDLDKAESWVHELERTFETMDCTDQDQFLETFHGEYFPDYACRETRDQFHELTRGDLSVAQYHQRWAMAGHLCDTLGLAVARATALERECLFQPQQGGGSVRSTPYQHPSGSRGSVPSSFSLRTGGAGLTSKLKKLFSRGGRWHY